jgi:hypothetical protein
MDFHDTDRLPDLTITVPDPPTFLVAGVPVRVTVLLHRPEDWSQAVHVTQLNCSDRAAVFEADLFQRDVEVRPGETYRVSASLRVDQPGTFDFASLFAQLAEFQNELARHSPHPVPVRPNLAREVSVTAETVCSYEEGTKLLVTLEHRSSTLFEDLRVSVEPTDAVRAGKEVRRQTFAPGEREVLEVVTAASEIAVVVRARSASGELETRVSHAVRPVSPRESRVPFRFLEPRRLSRDDIIVRRGDKPGSAVVRPTDNAFPVHSEELYQVLVRPQAAGVTKVDFRNSAYGRVRVRHALEDETGAWRFLVEVSLKGSFSRPDRVLYDVHTPDGMLVGELNFTVRPARWQPFRVAALAAGFVTLQGLFALLKIVRQPGFSLTRLLDLDFHFEYPLWGLLSLPVVWVGLAVVDWLQERLAE